MQGHTVEEPAGGFLPRDKDHQGNQAYTHAMLSLAMPDGVFPPARMAADPAVPATGTLLAPCPSSTCEHAARSARCH